jgi:hypothetical protein
MNHARSRMFRLTVNGGRTRPTLMSEWNRCAGLSSKFALASLSVCDRDFLNIRENIEENTTKVGNYEIIF